MEQLYENIARKNILESAQCGGAYPHLLALMRTGGRGKDEERGEAGGGSEAEE